MNVDLYALHAMRIALQFAARRDQAKDAMKGVDIEGRRQRPHQIARSSPPSLPRGRPARCRPPESETRSCRRKGGTLRVHPGDVPARRCTSAAAHVGMVPRMLRFKMQRPEALRWMLAEKQARLEIASAGNITALLSVRDYGDNAMARVHASKTLETMLDNVRRGPALAAPWNRADGCPVLQIVILPATAVLTASIRS